MNHGASWNFNRVFGLSDGEYFKWAASDDICKPTFICRCVEVVDGDASILIKPYYGYEKVLMAELSLLGRFHDVPEMLFYQRVHPEASSNLASAAEQQEFFDPALADRRTYPRLQLLSGYVTALSRFPLGPYDHLCCLLWIGKYLFQVKKWKRVILSLYRGTGTGGANRQVLEQLKQKQRMNGIFRNN